MMNVSVWRKSGAVLLGGMLALCYCGMPSAWSQGVRFPGVRTASEAVLGYQVAEVETFSDSQGELLAGSSAFAISDAGDVAVGTVDVSSEGVAYRFGYWNGVQGLRELPLEGSLVSFSVSETNINGTSVGWLVNESETGTLGTAQGFVADLTGGIRILPSPEGAAITWPTAINSSGQIAGYAALGLNLVACVWDTETSQPRLLSAPTPTNGSAHAAAYGINDSGTVVGWVFDPDTEVISPVRWDANGVRAPLPVPAGVTLARAVAVNASGEVAGYYRDPDSLQAVAVVWSADGQMTELGPCVVPLFDKWHFSMNDAGQVAYVGTETGGDEEELEAMAFLALWQDGAVKNQSERALAAGYQLLPLTTRSEVNNRGELICGSLRLSDAVVRPLLLAPLTASTPAVGAVTPGSSVRGSTLDVVITGANFNRSGTTLNFGSGITVKRASVTPGGAQINVQVAIDEMAPAGLHTVSVVNPDGQIGYGSFTVERLVASAPEIETVILPYAYQGDVRKVVVAGNNFTADAQLDFGPGIVVTESKINRKKTAITASIMVAADAPTGVRSITVTNPDGQFATADFEVKPASDRLPDLSGDWQVLDVRTKGSGDKQSYQIKARIAVGNDGGTRSGKAVVKLFVSDDATYDAADEPLMLTTRRGGKPVEAKLPPVLPTRSRTVTLPVLRFTVDVYRQLSGKHLLAVLDYEDVVAEGDETNNVVVSETLP